LISHLKEESLKSLISSIVANDKAYAIASDIISDRLALDLIKIGKHFDEGMVNFFEADHKNMKDIISDSGKKAFTTSPEISMLFSKLCLSEKMSNHACSLFGGREMVLSMFRRGEKFLPDPRDKPYIPHPQPSSNISPESRSMNVLATDSSNPMPPSTDRSFSSTRSSDITPASSASSSSGPMSNNSVTHVVEAELEADVECPIDINGIYRLAAADENEDDIINSYYPKSEEFGNLKEPKRA
jgi:hypothetical protein